MISNNKRHRDNIKTIFQHSLDLNSSTLLVCDYVSTLYLDSNNIHVIALGKSAAAMLEGAIKALRSKLSSALLVTKNPPESETLLNQKSLQVIISGHPIPDENSLYAGKRLIEFLQTINKDEQLLFLISGGTSALVEYFSDSQFDAISINELIKLNNWLLASDRNIMEVNQIRKQISGIKAGRLLYYIHSKAINALYISDVPNDKLSDIGSGLLFKEDVATKKIKLKSIPVWINELIDRSCQFPDLKIVDAQKIFSQIIFSNSRLCKSLQRVAITYDYDTCIMDEFLVGNTVDEAIKITSWLKSQKPGLYIWGAETHMSLPEIPGRGGRNQSFALIVARELQGRSNIVVLIAATDGNDGNTADAGAIVDGETINRGEQNGVSLSNCLNNANTGEFLSAAGDLLTLGATGTNVMDIIMAIIWE